MSMQAQDYVLLLTFFFELFCGISLVYLAIAVQTHRTYRHASMPVETSTSSLAQSTSSSADSPKSKRNVGLLDGNDEEVYDTSKLQLLLMGVVNIFSSVCCYLKFTIDTAGGDSEAITYLQWGICTPPIVVVICLVCMIDHETTMVLAFLQAITIFCGYIGQTETRTVFIFTWFVLGAIMFISTFAILLIAQHKIFQRNVKKIETQEAMVILLREHKLSKRLLILTITSWSVYPIIWAIEQSGNASTSSITIAHSCLAFFAKMSFGGILGWYRTRLGYESLSIVSIISSSSTFAASPISKILRRGTIDDTEFKQQQEQQPQPYQQKSISLAEEVIINSILEVGTHPNSIALAPFRSADEIS